MDQPALGWLNPVDLPNPPGSPYLPDPGAPKNILLVTDLLTAQSTPTIC